jgi:hypothetical protein
VLRQSSPPRLVDFLIFLPLIASRRAQPCSHSLLIAYYVHTPTRTKLFLRGGGKHRPFFHRFFSFFSLLQPGGAFAPPIMHYRKAMRGG